MYIICAARVKRKSGPRALEFFFMFKQRRCCHRRRVHIGSSRASTVRVFVDDEGRS
jgi:hypothetical protein